MNKTLIGALVVSMALLPSIASAASTPYFVEIDSSKVYVVAGTLLVEPTLQQDAGNAEIVSAVFLGTQWRVEVMCHHDSPVDCEGFVQS